MPRRAVNKDVGVGPVDGLTLYEAGLYGGRRLDWDPGQGEGSINKRRRWIVEEVSE